MRFAYYAITLLASILLTGIYMFKWHRHYDTHITLIFAIVPLVNLGYVLLAYTTTPEAALTATKLLFIGGCFLVMILMLAILSLCQIHVNRWIRVLFLAISSAVYLSAMTIGRDTFFYKSVQVDFSGSVPVLTKEYGPMHTAFIVTVIIYFLISFVAIIYSFARKNQIPRKILALLFLPEVTGMIGFFGGRQLVPQVELLPAVYVFAQAVYLVIAFRMTLYDVASTAADSIRQNRETGVISFNNKYQFLGSNEAARDVFPELKNLIVDHSLKRSRVLREQITPWLDAFRKDQSENRHVIPRGERDYGARVSWLYNNKKRCGYQITITDDTKNQQTIRRINNENEELQMLVDEKTQHLQEMHNRLVMGMATMVESRDNSTGGHIRRTSEGVRLLIRTIQQNGIMKLERQFCKNLIKAAPMHDLGKIAVDDRILRKPGRFEPEEYAEMKKHAPEGARIVHEILKDTDDEAFREVAENVAHYHHERWDGKGYPDGLTGEQIPLEARIMAIADVYDALVSKRVYKEKMSFEKADSIIKEGMGSQFDPGLKEAYELTRPALEAYYSAIP